MRTSLSWFGTFLVLLSALSSCPSFAQSGHPLGIETTPESSGPANIRDEKPFGISLGLLDPFPTFASFNISYNVFSFLRLHASTGVTLGTSYGLGASYIILPASSISPLIGIDVMRSDIVDFFSGFLNANGVDSDTIVWTSTIKVGMDWQTRSGFNLGAGVNWLWYQNPANTFGTTIFPYVSFGWFF